MTDLFKCRNCGWRGSLKESMKPEKAIEEQWKQVWELRKGISDILSRGLYLGAISGEQEMLNEVVCPKCATECERVEEE